MRITLEFTFYPKICHLSILKEGIEAFLRIAGLEWKWTFDSNPEGLNKL